MVGLGRQVHHQSQDNVWPSVDSSTSRSVVSSGWKNSDVEHVRPDLGQRRQQRVGDLPERQLGRGLVDARVVEVPDRGEPRLGDHGAPPGRFGVEMALVERLPEPVDVLGDGHRWASLDEPSARLGSMITARVFVDGKASDEQIDPADAIDDAGTRRRLPLARLVDPTDRRPRRALQKTFGVHPLTIEDVRHRHQRPKVEIFQDYAFVVLRPIESGRSRR